MAILTEDEILNYIKDICSDGKDELAYLAATSKIENFIRDKLAYKIYKNHKNDVFVARDFPIKPLDEKPRKIDIALLNRDSTEPSLFIELKASNTDSRVDGSFKHASGHINELDSQLSDIEGIKLPCLGILMAVHPCANLPNRQQDLSIKYHKEVNAKRRPELINESCGWLKNNLKRKTYQIEWSKYSLGYYNNVEIILLVHIILGSTYK
jgi:hypothetical protein